MIRVPFLVVLFHSFEAEACTTFTILTPLVDVDIIGPLGEASAVTSSGGRALRCGGMCLAPKARRHLKPGATPQDSD